VIRGKRSRAAEWPQKTGLTAWQREDLECLTGQWAERDEIEHAPTSSVIFDDDDFNTRLIDVLVEAELDETLTWQQVDAVLVLIERYGHLASETYWAAYLALAPREIPVEKREAVRWAG
jgi:hypothetical protein